MAKKTTKKIVKKAKAKKASPVKAVRKKVARGKPAVKRTSAQKAKAPAGEVMSMVGSSAPSIIVSATGGQNISLSDFSGRKVVLYFYPKDNTPGCTLEGADFQRLQSAFLSSGAVVIGVSKDSVKSHENFKKKFGFGFDLLADENEKLCQAFGVIQMKSLYGRQYLGIDRSTFVIDATGKVIREWRKVKVKGHAEEVLDYVRTL